MMVHTIRNFRFDDLPALVAIINRAAETDQEDTHTSLEELRFRFERPYFFPEQNCLVAVYPDGEIVGYTTAELDPRFGKGWGFGCVDPAHRGQGIGRALIQAADARHLEQAESDLPSDMGLYVTRVCRDTNDPTRGLFEAANYVVWRVRWFMHIGFDDLLDEFLLPTGFALRAFDRDRDAREVWDLERELFLDAPGYAQPPFEVWERLMFPIGHNDALWLIAVEHQADDEPVAGLCLCRPHHSLPKAGWVELLGIRAPYRRRGLGLALLRQGFQTLQAHGFTAAELEVDSENTSNAVALYERAGMAVNRRYLIYRKIVRGTV